VRTCQYEDAISKRVQGVLLVDLLAWAFPGPDPQAVVRRLVASTLLSRAVAWGWDESAGADPPGVLVAELEAKVRRALRRGH
jgi:hypothetical protein